MKCVVINGTSVRGCTYHLKEMFLNEIKPDELVEFYLPKDAPEYCTGCKRCFLENEEKCPHWEKVRPIWNGMKESDLIVFAYPVYVMRAPGHIKSLLDHLGVFWFAHRPDAHMFHKTAVIITQSIGAPNGSAQKDVKTSLHWLGVPLVKKIAFGMQESVIWEDISETQKKKFREKMSKFARGFKEIKRAKGSIRTKFYFFLGRKLQEHILKNLREGQVQSVDLQYWIKMGWVKNR